MDGERLSGGGATEFVSMRGNGQEKNRFLKKTAVCVRKMVGECVGGFMRIWNGQDKRVGENNFWGKRTAASVLEAAVEYA